MQVPILDLRREYEYMKEDIDSAIKRCLEHQKWIFGPEIKELEEKIAVYLGVKRCIGVSSGTEALVISMRALAIKLKGQEYFDRGDEIITTPFTFTATGDAILRAGATPVFVDIDHQTYNIDTEKINEYLTSGRSSKVVGIIPVHLYGQACDMGKINEIAKEYSLFVVEDVAQAFGGMWKGRRLGSIGTACAFSFFPSKNLGGFGDGGMVSTNDDEIAELVGMLLKHGGKDKYNVDHIGYNARLDTIQAAILLQKLKYIDEFNKKRIEIAKTYSEGLSNLKGLMIPFKYASTDTNPQDPSDDLHHVYHQYTIRVLSGKRDNFQRRLNENGISTMVYYPVPLHKMKVFEGRMKKAGDLKKSGEASSEVLSLPIEPLLHKKEINHVIESLRKLS